LRLRRGKARKADQDRDQSEGQSAKARQKFQSL
jgi:hypothetical protein